MYKQCSLLLLYYLLSLLNNLISCGILLLLKLTQYQVRNVSNYLCSSTVSLFKLDVGLCTYYLISNKKKNLLIGLIERAAFPKPNFF